MKAILSPTARAASARGQAASLVLVALVAATAAASAAAGCTGFDPQLSAAPFLCGDAEPKCPEDYECVVRGTAEVCELAGGGGSNLPVDSPTGGFQCASDGSLENNDTLATASDTRVGPDLERTFGPVSICPAGDKDHYRITVTAVSQAVELVVSWESGQPVAGALLGAGGAILQAATAMGSNMIRACAMLPTGTYYALVNAAADQQQNYRVTMRLAASCN